MSLNYFIIEDNAIFVADSHYNKKRQELKIFLLKLKAKEIKTSQLFLMGDMFDFLANEISYFKKQNNDIINLLNELSNTTNIIYLEGNHDYNLKILFPNILIISRDKQPFYCTYQNKKIALSHGDIFTPSGYDLYTLIIRNKYFLRFLNFIDINNWLTKKIDHWLLEKNICSDIIDFKEFAQYRVSLYSSKVDLIIEGHFHYGKIEKKYANIPSLACDKRYYLLNNDKIQEGVLSDT